MGFLHLPRSQQYEERWPPGMSDSRKNYCHDARPSGYQRQDLIELNEMVENGGEPVGFIYCIQENNHLKFYTRTLDEYAIDQCAADYLNANIETIRKFLEFRGNSV
jgi:hypothetical protein